MRTVRLVSIYSLWLAAAISLPAQTFTTLASFNGTNGSRPLYVALAQGLDGNFYGMTEIGGANNKGTIFVVTPGGALTSLHSFNVGDGAAPQAGMLLATDGNFYGATESGGANILWGSIFRFTPNGTLTTLHSFGGLTDGSGPNQLMQAIDGDLYGTTSSGGSSQYGTIFKISLSGAFTLLHMFANSEGDLPWGLAQGTTGNFYGPTSTGGLNDEGTIFSVTPAGALTILDTCTAPGPEAPHGTLLLATNGYFYGTSSGGGANLYGTVFRMTSGGTLTTMHSFGPPGGWGPLAGLVQATDGNFYGATTYGGASNAGTLFRMTPSGTLTTLHTFSNTDGANPQGTLVQGTDGSFYGVTELGGASGDGTIYRLSVGLKPFIKTLPSFGKPGASIMILGSNLAGSSNVTFNGTAAAFAVVSATEILATVPSGATSGKVQVTTPNGVLSSNTVFRVQP